MRAEIARMVERERRRSAAAELAQLWQKAVPESSMPVQTVYVEGVANLVGSHEDREQLREVLAALEAKQRLVELLNAYIDARQESVRVVFDLEQSRPGDGGAGGRLVAPGRWRETRGTVGVIGPKRDALREHDECGELYCAGVDLMLHPIIAAAEEQPGTKPGRSGSAFVGRVMR